jgi:uncharacterized membrane protein
MTTPEPRKKSFGERFFGPWTIFGIFAGAGTLHLVKPGPWIEVVPPQLPEPEALVAISGVAEIVGGIGYVIPQTRPLFSKYLVLLLIAVFPANIYMAVDEKFTKALPGAKTALLLRLPLQFVGMWWVRRLSKRTVGA